MHDPGLQQSDEIARLIATRQHADWRQLRFKPLTSEVAREAIAQLASRMRDTVWQSGPLYASGTANPAAPGMAATRLAKPYRLVSTSHSVSWSLALAAWTCLLAGSLVAVVGTTTVSLSKFPIVVLVVGTAVSTTLTIGVSSRLLWGGLSQERPDLALHAGAGLIMGLAALAATLIAGSG